MAKRLIYTLIALFSLQGLWANADVKLEASAPATVFVGKPFKIAFTANAKV